MVTNPALYLVGGVKNRVVLRSDPNYIISSGLRQERGLALPLTHADHENLPPPLTHTPSSTFTLTHTPSLTDTLTPFLVIRGLLWS